MSGTKKNPFKLLSKEARKEASEAGTQALNAETHPILTAPVVNMEKVESQSSTPPQQEQIIKEAAPIPEIEQESAVEETSSNEQTPQADSTPVKKGGQSAPKKGRTEKPSGPVAGSTARVTAKGIRILHLLSSVTGQPQYEVIEDCLKMHPMYAKIKGLL